MKKHIKDFMDLQCAADLLRLKLFPNAKEVTESMGAFSAVERTLAHERVLDWRNPKIAMVSVGDGATPRTAGLFAFRTQWQCYSIDPNLREGATWAEIERLTLLRRRVEDEVLDLRAFEQVVIALVHSHAPLDKTLTHIRANMRHVVAIPCCVPMELPARPYIGIDDLNIWSPKRTVKVWADV